MLNQPSGRQLVSLSNRNVKTKHAYSTKTIDITGKRNVDYAYELYQWLLTGGLYLIFKTANKAVEAPKYKFLFVRVRKAENTVEKSLVYTYDELLLWYDDMTRRLNNPEAEFEEDEDYFVEEDYDPNRPDEYDDIPTPVDYTEASSDWAEDYQSVIPEMMPVKANKLPSEFLTYFAENKPITAQQFKNDELGLKRKAVPGCYVIYDVVERKYYVGQAGNLWRRMSEHLNKGKFLKGTCYQIDENIRNGHKVYIRIITIGVGNIIDLDEMERKLIDAYDSYHHGYNLTQGNHR